MPWRTFSRAAAKFFATSASLMWICAIDSIIARIGVHLVQHKRQRSPY
jgi:hypothetical protein